MPNANVRRAPNTRTYLNAGCGKSFSPEWNNLDLLRNPDVVYHDLRQPLPYPDDSFDAVYSSHTLEHLTPAEGTRFIREMYRVCRVGGVCRIVVPDYERACREYLARLEEALADPTHRTIRRYRWSVFELIDQCVREKSGGEMLQALLSGDFDEEYVRERNGDEFTSYYTASAKTIEAGAQGDDRVSIDPSRQSPSVGGVERVLRDIRALLRGNPSPRDLGEVHRWIYDRLSLRVLLEQVGFREISVFSFDQSRVPDWSRYLLDTSQDGQGPRKPDSLYMEGKKTVA